MGKNNIKRKLREFLQGGGMYMIKLEIKEKCGEVSIYYMPRHAIDAVKIVQSGTEDEEMFVEVIRPTSSQNICIRKRLVLNYDELKEKILSIVDEDHRPRKQEE